jgi:diadenosine tetraphosphate (Ap4A) HIT family hydrolase
MASSESVFAKIPQSEYLHETKHFFVVFDGYPVSPGHCLIVSKAMRADFFDLSQGLVSRICGSELARVSRQADDIVR